MTTTDDHRSRLHSRFGHALEGVEKLGIILKASFACTANALANWLLIPDYFYQVYENVGFFLYNRSKETYLQIKTESELL